MDSKIKHFDGIFGEHSEPFDSIFLHHEPLEKRTSFYNYEITEHIHTNLVQIFILRSGEGLLLTAGEKIALDSPGVLLIPCNVLHGFVFSTEVEGDVFTISEQIFDSIIKTGPSSFSIFDQMQYVSFESGSEQFKNLSMVKEDLVKELDSSLNLKEFQLTSMLQIFLVLLYRSIKQNDSEIVLSDDRTLKHYIVFKNLIKQYIHQSRSVEFYASKMNMTPVHLNRICKMVVQKNTLQIIHEQVIREAKKYLKGTTHSIAEVAYLLDFKNPAHFSKFFRKLVGETPSEFRR